MVEYAMMLVLIAGVCIVAVGVIGGETNRMYEAVNAIWP
jgi:Flp pilus assembly pilin Flp